MSKTASPDTVTIDMHSNNAADKLKGDFIAFLQRGNVVDLAVGIIIGGAFTAIVNSFVVDLITLSSVLPPKTTSENSFIVIKCKKNAAGIKDPNCIEGKQGNYSTIAIANTAGALTWNWGRFVQICINFVLIALIVFFVVKGYSAAFLRKKEEAPKTTRACEFCMEDIHKDAVKCKFCGSHQEKIEETPFLVSGTNADKRD
ncbi:large-conductance mechanosensitive channel [Chytridium lagenaria]|nr:large-conductance mechanosensitive channel [Chytridium lagenaria]